MKERREIAALPDIISLCLVCGPACPHLSKDAIQGWTGCGVEMRGNLVGGK